MSIEINVIRHQQKWHRCQSSKNTSHQMCQIEFNLFRNAIRQFFSRLFFVFFLAFHYSTIRNDSGHVDLYIWNVFFFGFSRNWFKRLNFYWFFSFQLYHICNYYRFRQRRRSDDLHKKRLSLVKNGQNIYWSNNFKTLWRLDQMRHRQVFFSSSFTYKKHYNFSRLNNILTKWHYLPVK